MKYLTRRDTEVGFGEFDSIAWAFSEHIKGKDSGEYNYAVLHGNEDAPSKIELWRKEPDYDTRPDSVWIACQQSQV